MARKHELITELYEQTLHSITDNHSIWTAFLRSACRNYKCTFDEQVLIYAQRPDATAVLELDKWNKQFGRWVNKGAAGIAVFDREYNGNTRLKYYFDVSDTHESMYSRNVPVWSMQKEYETEVVEALENTFGELELQEDLASAIISAVNNAVDDNASDYISELMSFRYNSFLEELGEDAIEAQFKDTLKYSVA